MTRMLKGIFTDKPLAGFSTATSFALERVPPWTAELTSVPQDVKNYTWFEGALLAIVIKTEDATTIVGTASFIAPGLAVTATHVLTDHLEELMTSNAALGCIGPATHGLELWDVRKVSMEGPGSAGDVAYLSLEPRFAIPHGWKFRMFPLSTKAPFPDSFLRIVGFRYPNITHNNAGTLAEGELFMSGGRVANLYGNRDRVLMPFPCIEVLCGSLNGMGGGPVVDPNGSLVGVLSRGLHVDDGEGPSYAAWIPFVLDRRVEIPWPPGMYPERVHLLDIDERLLFIEGREKVRTEGYQTDYTIW